MNIDLDQYYMQMAIKEAKVAFEEDEVPVGAVVVHEGQVIAKAHNMINTLHDPTAHAEMLALTQASNFLKCERLIGTTLYVTLEPCAMCAGAMVLARIDKLVFATNDPKTGACGSLYDIVQDQRLNHQVEVRQGLFENESRLLLQEFFRGKRKKDKV